ncbi:MAG: acyltransferase family protein, partial [Pseudomonadales bacterium]
MSASDANTRRLAWVDLAKGICIFAVVVLYAVEMMRRQFGDAGWLNQVSDFAKPFRMPDFFLISGLFLARVINRPWASYLDKKVLHYAYFFVLWTVVNVGIEWAVQGADGGAVRLIRSLWSNLSSWPFHMLWFIQMLPAYFLF